MPFFSCFYPIDSIKVETMFDKLACNQHIGFGSPGSYVESAASDLFSPITACRSILS